MKSIILTTACWLLIIISFRVAFPQQKPITNKVQSSQHDETNQYKDWRKIDQGGYSFFVPSYLHLTQTKGGDGTYWEYKNEEVILTIFEGSEATEPRPAPGFGKHLRHTHLQIDGLDLKVAAWEEDAEEHKYYRGVAFKLSTSKVIATAMTFKTKNVENLDLAEKIFQSIRFYKQR